MSKIVKMPIADWLPYPAQLYINVGFGLSLNVGLKNIANNGHSQQHSQIVSNCKSPTSHCHQHDLSLYFRLIVDTSNILNNMRTWKGSERQNMPSLYYDKRERHE